MAATHITADEARRLVEDGALLVDVRELREFSAEHIPGASHQPLSAIAAGRFNAEAEAMVFYCKSGARTSINASGLAACTAAAVYLLDGGIEAWKKAGYPVRRGYSNPRSSEIA
jgi:rhodanese-related sulfurtransferase